MDSIDQAKKLMRDRLSELENERKAIEAALTSLDEKSAGKPAGSKRRRRSVARRAAAASARCSSSMSSASTPASRSARSPRRWGSDPNSSTRSPAGFPTGERSRSSTAATEAQKPVRNA